MPLAEGATPTRSSSEAKPPGPPEAVPTRSSPIGGGIIGGVRWGRLSAAGLLIGFVVLFGLLRPNEFLTTSNFQVTTSQGVETLMLGLAFLVPLCGGAYDLSIGAVMELSLAFIAWGTIHTGLPVWLLCIVAIALCCLVGMLSGILVVRFRVNSLIATLGVSEVLAAAELLISNNTTLVGRFPTTFQNLGNSNVAGVPLVLIYLLILAVILWFALEQTPGGRSLFAVGGNPEAARLAGVRTNAVVFTSLVASAAIAGLAGVIYAMQVGTYSAGDGTGLLFPALAAVFFGASQFSGRPNVWGTVIAFMALAFGVKGLQLIYGPSSFWIDPLFQGVALVIAVSLASRQVYQTRKSRRAELEPVVSASAT